LQILACKGRSGSNLEYALRLADCHRRLAPHIKDEHLFGIEQRLLEACEESGVEDEILLKLNYKLSYLVTAADGEGAMRIEASVPAVKTGRRESQLEQAR